MNVPIGVFDSGYGGLTVLKALEKALPEQDFLYLGDNARTPYGTRSFDVVYEYTLQAVKYLFSQNCPLIIVACNTASAKALRNIQMLDLPKIAPDNRVLGVIRPSVERVSEVTKNGHGLVYNAYLKIGVRLIPDICAKFKANQTTSKGGTNDNRFRTSPDH